MERKIQQIYNYMSRLKEVADIVFSIIFEDQLEAGTYTAHDLIKRMGKRFDRHLQNFDDPWIHNSFDPTIYQIEDKITKNNLKPYDLIEIKSEVDCIERIPVFTIFHKIVSFEKSLNIKPQDRYKWEVEPEGSIIFTGSFKYGNRKRMNDMSTLLNKYKRYQKVYFNISDGFLFFKDIKGCSAIEGYAIPLEYDSGFKSIPEHYFEIPIPYLRKFHGFCTFKIFEKRVDETSGKKLNIITLEFCNAFGEKVSIYKEINSNLYNPLNVMKRTYEVVIGEEKVTIPVKYDRKDGIIVDRIITPLKKDGTCPTLMAESYEGATYKNAVSTGHFPKPVVIEIWESNNPPKLPTPKDLIFSSKQEAIESPFINYDHKKNKMELIIPISINTSENLSRLTKEGFQERWRDEKGELPEVVAKREVANGSKARIEKAVANLKPNQYIRMRRLTPQETLRLMGVSENNIKRIEASGIKDKDIYKQAGNSIVVDTLYPIFKSMLIDIKSECSTT